MIEKSIGSEKTVEGGLEGLLSIGEMLTQRQRRRFKAGDTLLGRYRILSELGQGGMGLVYRCLDEVGGIEVAVKMLPPEVSRDSGEMEEVRENFVLVSSLVHQNICAVRTLEKDEATGEYYLVMELAQGMNLRQWRKAGAARGQRSEVRFQRSGGTGKGSGFGVQGSGGTAGEKRSEVRFQGSRGTGGGMPLGQVLPIVRQIAAALDFAHANKVIHRDVKPSNVMVDGAGRVKVLDFGLAAQIHTSFSRVSHVRYGTSGTGPYMAPEQWEGQYQNAATDQYALAVLTYELLTGRCPFESHEMSVLRESVLKSVPKCPPGLSPVAWAALSRALAKEREARFSSCGEFVRALGGETIQQAQKRKQRKRSGWKWVAGALILAGVAAGGWWALGRGQGAGFGVQGSGNSRGEEVRGQISEVREQPGEREQGSGDRIQEKRSEVRGQGTAEGREQSAEVGGQGTAVNSPAPAAPMPDPQAETGKPKVTYGDVVDLKGQAEAQWEAVEKLNSGQGFSEYQKQCKGIFNAAQDCFEKKEYDLAKERFEKVTNACARLLALDQQREKAKQVREQAENERETAQEQGAEKDARVLWTDAGGLMEKAAKEFKGGKFSAAQTNWTAAAQKYTEARDKAQKEAAARKAAEEAARKKITAGRNARIDDLQMDLIWVEKGNFEMGSENGDSDEKPVRWVTLTKGYWMGKTEVSNGQYQRFLRESGYDGSGDADSDYLRHFEGHSEQPTGDEYPIIWVSWKNADEFCKWLTQRERDAGRLPDGYVYRLPTEAEWEFAARGGTKSRGYQYSGGNDLDAVGWYDKNGGGKTHPVGGKKANELGLHDMSGNVWEWCWDWCGDYNPRDATDPKGPASGSSRVGRGGS